MQRDAGKKNQKVYEWKMDDDFGSSSSSPLALYRKSVQGNRRYEFRIQCENSLNCSGDDQQHAVAVMFGNPKTLENKFYMPMAIQKRLKNKPKM